MSSRQTKQIIGILVFLISILAIIFSNNSAILSAFKSSSQSPTPTASITRDVEGSSISNVTTKGESADQNLDNSPSTIEGQQAYKVVKVVDGDTIDVDIDGEKVKIRIIGIDTPETVDPRKPVQCFGKEASNKAKEILTNQFVTLEADESQGDKDKYGRSLRYIILPNGANYGLYMISEGYAHEYTYNLPYKYQAQYKQAEIDARNGNKGLWSPDTCSGNK